MLSQLHRNMHYIIHALFLEIQILFIKKKKSERQELSKMSVGNKLEKSYSNEKRFEFTGLRVM